VNKILNNFVFHVLFICSIFFVFSTILFFPSHALRAQEAIPSGTKPVIISGPEFNLYNPLTQTQEAESSVEIIGRAIQFVFSIVGALALLMFILGGAMWLISGGNETRIKKGRDIMVYALLGLILAFSSYIILNYVFAQFLGTQ